MAGIDKIYLTSFQEYSHLEQFCTQHNSAFYRKHRFYLTNGLYDEITEETFRDGKEHPVSNFSVQADLFLIKNFTKQDILNMPNVWHRLTQEQYHNADEIRENKSDCDRYSIPYGKTKLKFISWIRNTRQYFIPTNKKTLKHLKRERWECCNIDLWKIKNGINTCHLSFDYFHRIIYDRHKGVLFYKSTGEDFDCLRNVTIKQVIRYIKSTVIPKGTNVRISCYNHSNQIEAVYSFEAL